MEIVLQSRLAIIIQHISCQSNAIWGFLWDLYSIIFYSFEMGKQTLVQLYFFQILILFLIKLQSSLLILQFATFSIGFNFEQRLTVVLLLSMLTSCLGKVTKVYLQIYKTIVYFLLGLLFLLCWIQYWSCFLLLMCWGQNFFLANESLNYFIFP